jgi:hypothetical protein
MAVKPMNETIRPLFMQQIIVKRLNEQPWIPTLKPCFRPLPGSYGGKSGWYQITLTDWRATSGQQQSDLSNRLILYLLERIETTISTSGRKSELSESLYYQRSSITRCLAVDAVLHCLSEEDYIRILELSAGGPRWRYARLLKYPVRSTLGHLQKWTTKSSCQPD